MHDLKQLRADADAVDASAKAWLAEVEDLDPGDVEHFNRELRLAAFVRDITDPTPLTVDRLVEMGFIEKSASLQTWRRGTLRAMNHDGLFAFTTDSMAYVWPVPRTVGELRQLLLRMEG